MPTNGTKTAEFGEKPLADFDEKPPALSDRERIIAWLLMRGWRSRHIAEMLRLNEKTVDNHRARITKNLRGDSTLHALMIAVSHGLLDLKPNMRAIAKYEAKMKREPRKAEAPPALTDTERDIVWLLMRGYDSVKIAAMMGIDDKAVDNHRARLIKAMGAYNTLHAVMRMLWSGMVDFAADPQVVAKYKARLPEGMRKEASKA